MSASGPLKTDHVLFVAAGAFHVSKPKDLIPELQGRFPIRVELEALSDADFVRILTEPENALTKQYAALLATERIILDIRPDAVGEIARIAADVNARMENIGARRLHTVMEPLAGRSGLRGPRAGRAHHPHHAAYVQERLAAFSRTRICPSTCCDTRCRVPGSQYLCAPRVRGYAHLFAFRQGDALEITAVAACVLLLSGSVAQAAARAVLLPWWWAAAASRRPT